MKRVLVSALLGFLLFAVPGVPALSITANASGPPPPACIPDGNMCIDVYNAQYTDAQGATLQVTWDVDRNSDTVVSVSSSITPPGGANACNQTVSPPPPNSGPIFVSYDYTESGVGSH
jgi:hypothetical protein